MLKRSVILIFLILSLSACSEEIQNEKLIKQVQIEELATEEVKLDEEIDWDERIAEVEFEADDLENLVWEDLHLTKDQFDDFLNKLLDHPFNLNEIDDELDLEIEIKKIDFNGEEIDYTLRNMSEDTFLADFGQGLSIYTIDTFSRQYYLNSDYSEDMKQPLIRFYDEDGNLLSEHTHFIDLTIDRFKQ